MKECPRILPFFAENVCRLQFPTGTLAPVSNNVFLSHGTEYNTWCHALFSAIIIGFMAEALKSEVLKSSVKNGVRGVREVLMKEEQPDGKDSQVLDRAEQVQRAKTAVDFLRSELQTLSVPEKKRVVEASRLVIQDALDGVSGELQKEIAGARAKRQA